MNNDFMNSDVIKKLGSDKLELIKSLQKELEGKNSMEAMPIVLKYNAAFQKGDKVSKEDQAAIIEALKASLNDTERKKLESLLAMVGGFNK